MNIKDNQNDIILVIGVILISLISFGAGRLTAPQSLKQPLTIDGSQVANISQTFLKPENQTADTASTANSVDKPTTENQSSNQQNQVNINSPQKQGQFVASKSGKNYYWPWDSTVQRIKPENLIWFATEAQAQAAGYQRNAKFLQQAPAGYKAP